jgi:hypothetical protein
MPALEQDLQTVRSAFERLCAGDALPLTKLLHPEIELAADPPT